MAPGGKTRTPGCALTGAQLPRKSLGTLQPRRTRRPQGIMTPL
jgi:hypothetical protein